jgi:hypothetical protein
MPGISSEKGKYWRKFRTEDISHFRFSFPLKKANFRYLNSAVWTSGSTGRVIFLTIPATM